MHHAFPQRASAIVGAVAALIASGLPARAAADDKILLGGGAAITLNDAALCTLTAVGHDSAGRLIGFTSARCGGPGSAVVAEGAEGHGTVGTVVASDDALAYAVIEFDPAKVAPIADYEGFGIFGLGPVGPEHLGSEAAGPEPTEPHPAGPEPAGPEPAAPKPAAPEPAAPEPAAPDPAGPATAGHEAGGPVPGDVHAGAAKRACKLGRGTGLNCFDIGPAGVESTGEQWWQPGDDGAPITVDNLLVAMVRDGSVPDASLEQSGPGIALFPAILDDVNAKGGPGAGFGLG